MKPRAIQAPVIPYSIDFTAAGPGTAPAEIFDGSGTIEIVMSAIGGIAGVLFGDSTDMDTADDANSFPVGLAWVKTTIGPSSRFLSVVSNDGNDGTLYYYFPGQT
jgi:hypothetical protein